MTAAVPLSSSDTRREALCHEHWRLAARLARRYHTGSAPVPAVTASALRGLQRAADSYDPEAGIDFQAHAIPIIVTELKAHLRQNVWSRGNVDTVRAQLRGRIDAALAEVGADAQTTAQQLAEALEVSLEEVVDALALAEATPSALAPAGPQASPHRELADREQLVYELRYRCGMDVGDIAATLGVGASRIKRILAGAVSVMHSDTVIVAAATSVADENERR